MYLKSVVPVKVIVRLIHLMLCESKIVVRGSDVNLVSIITAALPRLLSPLSWECVHIPLKPSSLTSNDLIDCPTPFIVGIVSQHRKSTTDDSIEYSSSSASFMNRYHPIDLQAEAVDHFPSDVSLLDLDFNSTSTSSDVDMLCEALDYKDMFFTSSNNSSILSNTLCNDLLTTLKGNISHDDDHEDDDDDDGTDEDDEEEEDEFDGFCHNKQFLEHQNNELNEKCKQSYGPLIKRESLSSSPSKHDVNNSRYELNVKIANEYAYGLKEEEMEIISDIRDVLNKFISSLCDDVGSNWSKYGEIHPQQGDICVYSI